MSGTYCARPEDDGFLRGPCFGGWLERLRGLPVTSFQSIIRRKLGTFFVEVVAKAGIHVTGLDARQLVDDSLRLAVIANLQVGIEQEVHRVDFVLGAHV